MGRQIIKQPNGKYCIFSSVVDSVTCYHFDRQDLIDEFLVRKREEVTYTVDRVLRQLEEGRKPYFQFTMSYDEIFETIERCHGKDAADKMRKDMES